MDWQGWFMLGVVGLVFYGLARNLTSPDVLLMGGLVLVGVMGIVPTEKLFQGFTNEGMLTVGALFVVAAALRETGVLDMIGRRVLGRANTETGAYVRLAGPVIGMSAFLNNTPVVAMLLPIVSDWCRKHHISPSRLLLPMSYLAILGGTCTLIGTSTNLVVNQIMIDEGMPSMGLFELAYLGIPFAIIGGIYLAILGRRLLPDRKDLLEQFGETAREYLVDLVVQPGCPLIGQRVSDAGLRRLPGLYLMEIARDGQTIVPVGPDEILHEGDVLTFTGVVSTIIDLERIAGLVPVGDASYETEATKRRYRRLCEAVISRTSPLIGKNIRDANFRATYNAAVIAVHRGGERLKQRIGDIVLQEGDTLLLQATSNFVAAHRNNPDFFLVSRVEGSRPVRHDRAWIALGLLGLLIVLMSTKDLTGIPIVMSAFLVGGLMVVTRCISVADARQSVDWSTLITIGAAFGIAAGLTESKAAETIVHTLLVFDPTGPWGPMLALAATYLVTMAFTEMVTNNAAAVLVFPFAMALAQETGVSAQPFAVAVMFAASASFLTPIGYQTNMMVYGPGGYKLKDFLRVGLPLDAALFVTAMALIPMIWPFYS